VLVAPRARLSLAQVEVLQLYATGVTAQQIASVRRCSVETVKTHLDAVKTRYEAHGDAVYTRTDMLRVALRDRLFEQDWHLADGEPGHGRSDLVGGPPPFWGTPYW
jgi:DNA-binding CsgD family transcriptional regulator